MADRHELIERYRGARQTLADAVAGHPEAAVGTWSGEDVLLHVAAWDREGVAEVRRRLAGEPARHYDFDAFNAAAVGRLRNLDDAARRAEFEAAGEAFAALVLGLPDEALADGAAGEDWASSLADHALEHAAFYGDVGA